MKTSRCFLLSSALLLFSGCASTDRMVRMSGGVLDEYSAPKSYRVRSGKYQKVSRSLASPDRAAKGRIAGVNDAPVNLWPFFFGSRDYWTILWPLIDRDAYGFAIRPLYNHEGDDYSILFPLSAWNPAAKHGWVTLFGWTPNGCGLVPLTWQWSEGETGGGYYTPLCFWNYDRRPLGEIRNSRRFRTSRKDFSLFALLWWQSREVTAKTGKWSWLIDRTPEVKDVKFQSEWNYRFDGKKTFPKTDAELDGFRREVFAKLPQVWHRSYGLLPLWIGGRSDDGEYFNRFLLLAGNSGKNRDFDFDVLGQILGRYYDQYYSGRHTRRKTSFVSLALMSGFSSEWNCVRTGNWKHLDRLQTLVYTNQPFSQKKPEILDRLKKLDPRATLPPTVTDDHSFGLFMNDLGKKYDFPLEESCEAVIAPLFWYGRDPGRSYWVVPALLSGQKTTVDTRNFTALPLLTFIRRSPWEDRTTVLTPLVYFAKEQRRKRYEYPVFPRTRKNAPPGWQCPELADQYALCGLFYRGRYGFNVAKEGCDAMVVENLRHQLTRMYDKRKELDEWRKKLDKETQNTDRWQTKTEIERLKKLIRYEELKLERSKLAKAETEYAQNVAKMLKLADGLKFPLDAAAIGNRAKASAAAEKLLEQCTELRRQSDWGNGLFFRRENFYNGDFNWHFCHILAGGSKNGPVSSTHILHLLYRYRREGRRTERIIFPFITTMRDGDDTHFSFLWRVFSLTRSGGKTGGHILFIPFGEKAPAAP